MHAVQPLDLSFRRARSILSTRAPAASAARASQPTTVLVLPLGRGLPHRTSTFLLRFAQVM
jgi:hypothetical protein